MGEATNGRQGSLPSFSQLSVPLTTWHLHFKPPEWNIYLRKRAAEVCFMKLLAHTHICNDSWYTRVAGAGSKRKMVQGR